MDPYVIDIPTPLRWLLVHGIILRTRPSRSAAAYEKIWSKEGSPLLFHTRKLTEQVNTRYEGQSLKDRAFFCMRYGEPSISSGITQILENTKATTDGAEIFVIPLYPHFADSATTTALAKFEQEIAKAFVKRGFSSCSNKLGQERDGIWRHLAFKKQQVRIQLKSVPHFYQSRMWIDSLVGSIKNATLEEDEFLLLSFHGLPERHIKKRDRDQPPRCLISANCCAQPSEFAKEYCYRAQCFQTLRDVQRELKLPIDRVSLGFQSRLGRNKWIDPSTTNQLVQLRKNGVEKLVVACPSFVGDCLETLEEVNIALREQWTHLGGKSFRYIACLNETEMWVDNLTTWLTEL